MRQKAFSEESLLLKNIPSNGSLPSNDADKLFSGRNNPITKRSEKSTQE